MGWTHYWYRPAELNKDKFTGFMQDVHKLIKHLPKEIVLAGPNGQGLPQINSRTVNFNGAGDYSYESFTFNRNLEGYEMRIEPTPGMWFAFCKTAHLPYDLMVVATLCAARHHFGDEMVFKSDGARGVDELTPLQPGYDFWINSCQPREPKPLEQLVARD